MVFLGELVTSDATTVIWPIFHGIRDRDRTSEQASLATPLDLLESQDLLHRRQLKLDDTRGVNYMFLNNYL